MGGEVECPYLIKCCNMACVILAPDSQSPAPGLRVVFRVVEVFGTNGRRGEGENLVLLNNQCFRQVEFVNSG